MIRVVKGLSEAKKAISDIRIKQKELMNEKGFSGKVQNILSEVEQYGDKALIKYTEEFDHVKLQNISVSDELLKKSWDNLDQSLKDSLSVAAKRIKDFHEISKPKDWYDQINKYGIKNIPLEKVGIYIPGGNAPLLSTVLMTAIPARVAGVSEIYISTPPSFNGKPHPSVLAACYLAKVDKVYSIGGAQSIASFAYGTDTIPKVDIICGPGNRWVTEAKRQVFGEVGIDGLYGPTETFLIADSSSNPTMCAADLLAQAEHDVLARATMLTNSHQLAQEVSSQIETRLGLMTRGAIASKSIENRGLIAVLDDLEDAIDLTNQFAPEHLSLVVDDTKMFLDEIKNVGVIFVGEFSQRIFCVTQQY